MPWTRSTILFASAVCLFAGSSNDLHGQDGIPTIVADGKPLVLNDEMRYYDFWIGQWRPVGRSAGAGTYFTVTRTVHPGALREEWRSVPDSGEATSATAIRAWDKTTNRWMYTWVSSNGLYQVWQGRKVGADWYIYNRFDIEGDRYLSRQAWIPAGPDRVVRTSEKSYDEGLTWQLRFRQEYERVARADTGERLP